MPTDQERGHFREPPPDRDATGTTRALKFRIRAGWFGFAVAEELVEHHDGSRTWRRCLFPVDIEELKRRA